MNKIRFCALAILIPLLFACEDYNDYTHDNPFDSMSFSSSKPLRTVIARGQDMTFNVGVAIGGKREFTTEEWAEFVIDPALITNAAYTLLPADYYSLSNSKLFYAPAGRPIADVTVTLNYKKFTSDPLATGLKYVLPFRLVRTKGTYSVDSLINSASNPDYSVVAIKYVSQNGGFYYRSGVQDTLKADGSVQGSLNYSSKDLSKNPAWELKTRGVDSLLMAPSIQLKSPNVPLILSIKEDNSVMIYSGLTGLVIQSGYKASFVRDSRTFNLDYKYSFGSKTFHVVETLIQRQDPELDLRFETY